MDKKIGFIGAGNMASAMIKGILKSNIVSKENILVSEKIKEVLEKAKRDFGVVTTQDNKEVARKADILILAVKPYIYEIVLEEIKDVLSPDTIVVSIGAGISLGFLKKNLNDDSKFIKTMPNTPALVGEGMTAISIGENLKENDIEDVVEIFKSFSRVEIIEEDLMDAFTAIAGSSPAYIFILIEAMADGGVREGLQRDTAYKMAAQAVLGSAKMILETDEHPGVLKDRVCSPGGTTIEAVISLEDNRFRASVAQAIKACAQKSKEMKK